MAATTQPCFFIPHGGGPCFFMPDPSGIWTNMASFLRGIVDDLPSRPRAILVVTAHWETTGFAFTGAARPSPIYDYHGFPAHTYALRYDVPGDPALAARASHLLLGSGIASRVDPVRGLDHGVFVPLKVAFPDADIPLVAMSLDRTLDPALHLAAGRALAPLRDDGVLILGSGMSFHNLRRLGDPLATEPSLKFDQWLLDAVAMPEAGRAAALEKWVEAPGGRFAHPEAEHLVPLMVVAGASAAAGRRVYNEMVGSNVISAFRFD